MSDRREEQEAHGDKEDIVCHYVFECTQELSNRGSDFTEVYNEFVEYKVSSNVDEELPAPSKDVQKDHLCVNELFGKDKPNAPHSKLSKIHSISQIKHKIHHLHTFDNTIPFHKWKRKNQYHKTSNIFVIYSFFKFKGVLYFYVVDLVIEKGSVELPDGGHEVLSSPISVQQWINDASAFETKEKIKQYSPQET